MLASYLTVVQKWIYFAPSYNFYLTDIFTAIVLKNAKMESIILTRLHILKTNWRLPVIFK